MKTLHCYIIRLIFFSRLLWKEFYADELQIAPLNKTDCSAVKLL